MKIKVIIIGLGRIGKRHMQAVLRLGSAAEIIGYDNHTGALDGIEPFGRENNLDVSRVVLEPSWERIVNQITPESIVIVATTALGRSSLLEKVIACGPKAVICEKPVCQSLDEYKEVLKVAEKFGVEVYCNFSRHVYPCYQQIHESLEGQPYFCQAVFQGGMACVGIHFLELFIWLCGPNHFAIDDIHFDKVHETERPGFYDFYGSLSVTFNQGSRCWLVATPEHHIASVGITAKDKEFRVFEGVGQMIVSGAPVSVQPVDIVPTSRITDQVIKNILDQKPVLLPDIKQVMMAHEALFEAMARGGLEAVNIT